MKGGNEEENEIAKKRTKERKKEWSKGRKGGRGKRRRNKIKKLRERTRWLRKSEIRGRIEMIKKEGKETKIKR